MPFKGDDKRFYQRWWVAIRRGRWLWKNGPCVICGAWRNLQLRYVGPSPLPEGRITQSMWSWSDARREAVLKHCEVWCVDCRRERVRIEYGTELKHGTRPGYDKGCRCQPCRGAQADYQREWVAQRKARGSSGSPSGGGSLLY